MSVRRILLQPASVRLVASPKFHLPQHRFASRAAAAKPAVQPTLNQLGGRLKAAKDTYAIHTSYLPFVEALATSNDQPDFKQQHVEDLIRKLLKSDRPEDVQCIYKVFRELVPRLGIPPSLKLYNVVTDYYAQRNDWERFGEWIKELDKLPGNFEHSVDAINDYIEMFSFPDVDTLVNTCDIVFRGGRRPDLLTVAIFFSKAADIRQRSMIPDYTIISIIRFVKRTKLAWSREVAELTLERFREVGHESFGRRLLALYAQLKKPDITDPKWLARMKAIRDTGGIAKALEYIKSADIPLKQRSVYMIGTSLLQGSRSLEDLILLDQELGREYASRRWASVINNQVSAGDVDGALVTYRAALIHGVPLDAAMVSPILYALAMGPTRGSHEATQTCLELYNNLIWSYSTTRSTNGKVHPDLDVYRSIFIALSYCPHPRNYESTVRSLIQDMDTFKIRPSASLSQNVAVVQIRLSETPEEALQVYENHRHNLTTPGFAFILQALVAQPFAHRSIVHYLPILKDMQRAGHASNEKIYTTLLHSIGLLASKIRLWSGNEQEDYLRATLRNITRQAHDYLTLDSAITPTAKLLSQLMNTYQRLGCFGDAYRVWELMYLTGRYTPPAISNILDGCGYAGDLHTAVAIWGRLTADHYHLDLKCWETYIECLGRIGEIDKATKVLLFDMPATGFDRVSTARILMSMADKHKVSREMRTTLMTHDAELYHRMAIANRMDYRKKL